MNELYVSEPLLVDPVLLSGFVAAEFLGLEPESDLLVGGLDGVRAVTDVASNLKLNYLKRFYIVNAKICRRIQIKVREGKLNITKFFRIDQISVYYLSHQHWHHPGYGHSPGCRGRP